MRIWCVRAWAAASRCLITQVWRLAWIADGEWALMDGAAAYKWLRERQKRPVRGGIKGAAPRCGDRCCGASRSARELRWLCSLAMPTERVVSHATRQAAPRPRGGLHELWDLVRAPTHGCPSVRMLDKFESEKRAKKMAESGDEGVPLLRCTASMMRLRRLPWAGSCTIRCPRRAKVVECQRRG